jgi:hypothetical protein
VQVRSSNITQSPETFHIDNESVQFLGSLLALSFLALQKSSNSCLRLAAAEILHVGEEVFKPCKGLYRSRQNLTGREHEAIIACISEFHSERIFGLGDIIHVIDARASSLVDSGADGPVLKLSAVNVLDGTDGAAGERLENVIVASERVAVVAVC